MFERINEAIKSPRTLLVIGICIFLFTAYTFSYSYAQKSPWRMNTQEALKLAKQGDFDLIIDVRTPLERKWFPKDIEATPIPISQLETEVPTLLRLRLHNVTPDSYVFRHTFLSKKGQKDKKDAKILVFCMSGQRAKYATNKLHKMGYNGAYYATTLFPKSIDKKSVRQALSPSA